jgi:hypothetical protein
VSCLTTTFDTVNAVTADFAPRTPAHIAAAALLGAEAIVVGLAAALYVVFAVVGDSESVAVSIGIAVVMALAAFGLGFLARGLWRARRWAVSPAITWQVLQGFVAAYAISIGSIGLGAAALALAVFALVALVLIARRGPSGE